MIRFLIFWSLRYLSPYGLLFLTPFSAWRVHGGPIFEIFFLLHPRRHTYFDPFRHLFGIRPLSPLIIVIHSSVKFRTTCTESRRRW